MLIQIPVYGSDESVTMTPYELTLPFFTKYDFEGSFDYFILDEIAVTRICVFSDACIRVSIDPHDFYMVENLHISREKFFQNIFLANNEDLEEKRPVELSEIEETLKRFAVLLHNQIDKISTNVKPF